MTPNTAATNQGLFGDTAVGTVGKIAIRVVVLPKKRKPDLSAPVAVPQPLDMEADELLPESGGTSLSSYLESGKGGRQCCVFLVNGQRQDTLDNTFIIQQLGFKYLRNGMMIIVDVDELAPEAIGRLMQGSRQGFYRGDVWDAIIRRLIATLKDDPDLLRMEEEAEEQVSELEAGDEKVKQTLDQLIESHHEHGMHFAQGAGTQGTGDSNEHLGVRTVTKDGVVSLLPPTFGAPADYPVLASRPAGSSIRLQPNIERDISITSMPSNAWPALAELSIQDQSTTPELRISQERLSDHTKVSLLFREPEDIDADQYPIRATLSVTARFNGISEPRRIDLRVLVKPDVPPLPQVLNDPPTWLRVSSRLPIKIKHGEADTHVRLRWDGKDELAIGPTRTWAFHAHELNHSDPQPTINFSEPYLGRLTLLISPRAEWAVGDNLQFEVTAFGPGNNSLSVTFPAEVIEETTLPGSREPRLVDAEILSGASRRAPYELKYIGFDDYQTVECWGGVDWTDEDPGCFKEPTERTPLTLIINKDMAAVREYRRFLTRTYTETEVERRINKYTSHVAFHLYQMYQAVTATRKNTNGDGEANDQRHRAEIQRVAMTLIKLMEVSR